MSPFLGASWKLILGASSKSPSVLKVVFLVGATASGKSDIALKWSEDFGGEILNADSVQFYRDLKVGAAQPSDDAKRRVIHHLYEEVSYPEEISAGDFRRRALEKLNEIQERASKEAKPRVVFVVGGSGFYLQALEKGMYPKVKLDPEVEKALKDQLQVEGLGKLHEELKGVDPEWANKVSANDSYRILRGLGVFKSSGKRLSDMARGFEGAHDFPFPLLKLGVLWRKEELKERIRHRTEKMISDGLLNEVDELLKKNWGGWSPLRSVGYREAVAWLNPNLRLTDKPELTTNLRLTDNSVSDTSSLKEQIVSSTLLLAKRQQTWFKRDKMITWFHPKEQLSLGEEKLKTFLQS